MNDRMIIKLKRKVYSFEETDKKYDNRSNQRSPFVNKVIDKAIPVAGLIGTGFAAHRGYLGGRLMKISNRALYNVGNAVGSNPLMNKGYHGYIAGHLKTSGVLTGQGAQTFYKYGLRGINKDPQNSFKMSVFNGKKNGFSIDDELYKSSSMLSDKFGNINSEQYGGIKKEELPNFVDQYRKNYYKQDGGRSSYYIDGAKGYTGETYSSKNSNTTTNTTSNNTSSQTTNTTTQNNTTT